MENTNTLTYIVVGFLLMNLIVGLSYEKTSFKLKKYTKRLFFKNDLSILLFLLDKLNLKKLKLFKIKVNLLYCFFSLGNISIFVACSSSISNEKMQNFQTLEHEIEKFNDYVVHEKILYFMRHGQTDWNVQQKEMGWTDVELNETGKKQVLSKIDDIQKFGIKTIISSPLRRTFQTAEIINEVLNVELIKSEGLKERRSGVLEGKSYAEDSKYYDEIVKSWEGEILPENAETWKDVAYRSIKAINEGAEKCENPILFVSHGGVFRAIYEIFKGEIIDVENCHIEFLGKSFLEKK